MNESSNYLKMGFSYFSFSPLRPQGSFIKFAKTQISKLDRKLSESEAKAQLLEKIDDYRREKIVLAGEGIMEKAKDKIKDGDVIMTYSCSSIITKVLIDVSSCLEAKIFVMGVHIC